MKLKRRIIFCSIYFLAYFVFAMPYSQYIPYLTEIGYSATQRGLMISCYSVMNIVFQLIFGYFSDKYNKAKEILIISLLLMSVSTLFLFSFETQIFLLHLLLVALSGGLVNTNFGLLDTWLYTNGDDTVENFGFIRAFGSLGWAVASLLISNWIAMVGYTKCGISIVFLSVLTLGFILLCKNKKVSAKKNISKISLKDVKRLVCSKTYLLLVGIMFLLTCVTSMNSSVIVDKFIVLGASSAEIGLKWAINGVVEIPCYLLGSKILEKLGANKLLILGAFTLAIQYFFYASVGSVNALLIVSAGQMFTGPFVMLSSRMLFRKYAPIELQSTALLLGLSIYQGISMFVMPIVGGFLTDNVSVNATLYIVVIFAVVGIILSAWLDRMTNKQVS